MIELNYSTELSLSHLWLDDGMLLARDHSYGYLILCSETEFHAGRNDSLKKNWKVSESRYHYRVIPRKKKCYAGAPVALLIEMSKPYTDIIQNSFNKVYKPVGNK